MVEEEKMRRRRRKKSHGTGRRLGEILVDGALAEGEAALQLLLGDAVDLDHVLNGVLALHSDLVEEEALH